MSHLSNLYPAYPLPPPPPAYSEEGKSSPPENYEFWRLIREMPLMDDQFAKIEPSKELPERLLKKIKMALDAQVTTESWIQFGWSEEFNQRTIQIKVLNAAIKSVTEPKLSLPTAHLYYARAYQHILTGDYTKAAADFEAISMFNPIRLNRLKLLFDILVDPSTLSASEEKARKFLSQPEDKCIGQFTFSLDPYGLTEQDVDRLWLFRRPVCEELLRRFAKKCYLYSCKKYPEKLSKTGKYAQYRNMQLLASSLVACFDGNPIAQYYRAARLDTGFLIEKNSLLAREYFELSANQGFGYAVTAIGCIYERKHYRTEQDIAEMIRYYQQGIEKGNAMAAYNLAHFYLNGIGVQKDLNIALTNYRISAGQGFAPALEALAKCYAEGTGVAIDTNIAWKLNQLASASTPDEIKITLEKELLEMGILQQSPA